MRLLNGTDELRPSNNPWDWLGSGIYFWEQNPHRALAYAEEAARQQQKFSGRIGTPFVIGAVIELGRCLNLIDPGSISIVKEGYFQLSYFQNKKGDKMPVNKGANRQLDCAVINCIHNYFDEFGLPPMIRYEALFMKDCLFMKAPILRTACTSRSVSEILQ